MRTHPLNVTHLTLGLILLGIAGLWGANQIGWIDGIDSNYLVPSMFIGAGLIGLLAFGLKGRGRDNSPASR